MNIVQVDLFGQDLKIPYVEKVVTAPPAKKEASTVLLGRRRVFAGDTARPKKTVCTSSPDITLARVEDALGLRPVVSKGRWVRSEDGKSPLYRVTESSLTRFIGQKKLGPIGSYSREMQTQIAIHEARTTISRFYTGGSEEYIVEQAISLLSIRLIHAEENECSSKIAHAMIEVLSQQDFLDKHRSGETDRAAAKRNLTRAKRFVEQAKLKGEELSLDVALRKAMECGSGRLNAKKTLEPKKTEPKPKELALDDGYVDFVEVERLADEARAMSDDEDDSDVEFTSIPKPSKRSGGIRSQIQADLDDLDGLDEFLSSEDYFSF